MWPLISAHGAHRGPRWEKDPKTSFSEWCDGGEEDYIGTEGADGEVCMSAAV